MRLAFKLLHTRYRVDDLDRSVKFYQDVLGLEEIRRSKSPRGSELVFLKAPESDETIELCSFPDSGPVQVQSDLTHLAFQVENLETFARHLESRGLRYSDGPHMKPDGSGFAVPGDAPRDYPGAEESVRASPCGAETPSAYSARRGLFVRSAAESNSNPTNCPLLSQ